jgi:hypothetical protein
LFFCFSKRRIGRRIGGLEEKAIQIAHKAKVGRRIGGLEADRHPWLDHWRIGRRIGGLEDLGHHRLVGMLLAAA